MSEQLTTLMQEISNEILTVRSTENQLKERRKKLMQQGYDSGMTYQAIGDALGVTKAYVHQQIGKHREIKPVETLDSPSDGNVSEAI
jgi:DNA-directed RNA polymerase specialized sigma subunit